MQYVILSLFIHYIHVHAHCNFDIKYIHVHVPTCATHTEGSQGKRLIPETISITQPYQHTPAVHALYMTEHFTHVEVSISLFSHSLEVKIGCAAQPFQITGENMKSAVNSECAELVYYIILVYTLLSLNT